MICLMICESALRVGTEGVRHVVMDSEFDSSKGGGDAQTETPKTERKCRASTDGFLGCHGCRVLRQLQPEDVIQMHVGSGQGLSEKKK
jgi:hypothetical protein